MTNKTVKPNFLGRIFSRGNRAQPKKHAQVRRYKAAKAGRLVNGFGSLMASSPRAETRQDLRGLIAHSRHAAQNVDFLKSYEMMVRRHVVGSGGIALQMAVKQPDGKADKNANHQIETAWAMWGKRGNCTPCGRLSWWQVEKIAATMLAREGNFFLRKWKGKAFGPFGFQVQPLSIDLLDIDMVQSLKDGSYIDGGIEFNQFGKPLAYHFLDGHPAEPHTARAQTRIRIPANKIIHTQRHSQTGQALGVPESHTSLRRFNMLSNYEESALTAAHYGAAAMVFIEQEVDGTPAPAPDGDTSDEMPEEMEAGTVVELPPGYKANANPSSYPDANMPGFMKAMIRGGAVGLGVSNAALSGDMEGANFSSLKDGRSEERDEWRVFQRDLFESLHDPVFDEFLPAAIITNQVKLPFAKLDKFCAAKWRGRGWASVNPKDDARANKMEVELGTKTLTEIAADKGRDIADIASERAAEIELFKALGIGLNESEERNLIDKLNKYGVGVRAGSITPQVEDEQAFRGAAGFSKTPNLTPNPSHPRFRAASGTTDGPEATIKGNLR